MMPLKNDRALLNTRMQAALEQLPLRTTAAVDTSKLAVFGFCFGGCCALDLARTGAPVKAAVSFHGTLDSPNPADAKNIKGSVLVFHGASDPLVPKEQLPAFEDEMNAAGVDWQLTSYGGALHSFTDPHANVPGKHDVRRDGVQARVYRRCTTCWMKCSDWVVGLTWSVPGLFCQAIHGESNTIPRKLWELACQRRRRVSRYIRPDTPPSLQGFESNTTTHCGSLLD
jgi:hypothetical protein